MPGGIVERLRALQKPARGGAFFGSQQTQLFIAELLPGQYATTSITPGTSFYALVLYNVRFPLDLEPNAFSFNLLHRGDLILSAVLTSDYIDTGFELLTPITAQLPLTMRIYSNDDTEPQQWVGSFDILTVQTEYEYQAVIDILNDERPDIARILGMANPPSLSSSPMEQIGTSGGPFRQDNYGTPLSVFPDSGTTDVRTSGGITTPGGLQDGTIIRTSSPQGSPAGQL